MTQNYYQHNLFSSWLDTYSKQNNVDFHHVTSKKKDKIGQRLGAHEQGKTHFWQHDPQAQLQTISSCQSLTLSTGGSLFEEVICPLISSTTTELIFVTCFWAESPSLAFLGDALRRLAKKSLQSQTLTTSRAQKRIRVRISFSSLSLFQKLFHTRSSRGHTYPPSTWVSKLGLPDPEMELLPGLDMTVTSFFWLPFSVMHPKFVVVDREVVALPSCNVSWEEWFEGCMVMRDSDKGRDQEGGKEGGIVEKFVKYAEEGWDMTIHKQNGKGVQGKADGLMEGSASNMNRNFLDKNTAIFTSANNNDVKIENFSSRLPTTVNFDFDRVPTLFLPSSHHFNPRFRPFPWQKTYAPPPPTPLNTFLLTAFASATSSIYIHTPNVTCRPVLEKLIAALSRGVDVTLVTSERLMVLEQLVTAGRTTKRCVKELVRRYEAMSRKRLSSTGRVIREDMLEEGLVEGQRKMGVFRVMFFEPHAESSPLPAEPTATRTATSNSRITGIQRKGPNPVQSHLKLTIIDGEITVLGSGNMDRASWYTSRELGVGFVSREMAGRIMEALFGRSDGGEGGVLKGRVRKYYDSWDMMDAGNG